MTARILITDDDSDYRQSVMEILELEGYTVIGAVDGEAAVQVAQHAAPQLILCDIDMPKLDGLGVLAALKSDAATAAIPFVLITGRTDPATIERGHALGAAAYLTKPLPIDQLLTTIAHLLSATPPES